MKRSLVVLIALIALAGCTVIKPGNVGIVVHQTGTDRGVQSYVAVTGRQWYNPFTYSVFQWPTSVQSATWTKSLEEGAPKNEELTFTTADSMAVAADISLGYSLESSKVPAFYVKFRTDDLNAFTHGFLRNITRDHMNEVAGKFSIMQVMGDNEPFLKEVRRRLQKDLEPYGVHIEQFGLIGAPRPPLAVIESINTKVQAGQIAQQKQMEITQAEAEAKKKIAIAEGDARANEILVSSISDRLMDYRRLEILEKAVAKWNGVRPSVEGVGSGGLLLSIPTPGTK